VSERQILITIDEAAALWDDEDQEWLMGCLTSALNTMLSKRDYTIQEFQK